MKEFLKKLYKNRSKKLIIIILDENRPGEDEDFAFKPSKLFNFIGFIILIISIILVTVFMATPMGEYIYSRTDVESKRTMANIIERISALQDTLDARDTQLEVIKTVIRTNTDTILAIDESALISTTSDDLLIDRYSPFKYKSVLNSITASDLALANVLLDGSDFPAPYPIKGSLTRVFDIKNKHYGIDIATKKDELFTSVGNGTVIAATWTISYGYVISIQHKNAIISTYKHATKLHKKEGDSVHKGDILGLVGNVGTSSSGSHLHFEIWKDGIPQNPILYLNN